MINELLSGIMRMDFLIYSESVLVQIGIKDPLCAWCGASV